MNFKHGAFTGVLAVNNLGFANLALQWFTKDARHALMGHHVSIELQLTRHSIHRSAEFLSGFGHGPEEKHICTICILT